MAAPLLEYRQPISAADVLTEAVPRRFQDEGSALNLSRAALLGVPPSRVGDLLELFRTYRGGRPNSLILGGPLGWTWQATLDEAHHGSLNGPVNAHRHSDLAGIGIDDHHDRDHAVRHDPLQADALSTAYFRTDGSLDFAGVLRPDGDGTRDLGSAGRGWGDLYLAGKARTPIVIGNFNNNHLELQSNNADWGWLLDTADLLGGNVPLRLYRKSGGAYDQLLTVTQDYQWHFKALLRPWTDAMYDLGTGSFGWKDLYLSGHVKSSSKVLSIGQNDLRTAGSHLALTFAMFSNHFAYKNPTLEYWDYGAGSWQTWTTKPELFDMKGGTWASFDYDHRRFRFVVDVDAYRRPQALVVWVRSGGTVNVKVEMDSDAGFPAPVVPFDQDVAFAESYMVLRLADVDTYNKRYVRVEMTLPISEGGSFSIPQVQLVEGRALWPHWEQIMPFNWDIDRNILPSGDNVCDLGSSSRRWQDLYLGGQIKFEGGALFRSLGIDSRMAVLRHQVDNVATFFGVYPKGAPVAPDWGSLVSIGMTDREADNANFGDLILGALRDGVNSYYLIMPEGAGTVPLYPLKVNMGWGATVLTFKTDYDIEIRDASKLWFGTDTNLYRSDVAVLRTDASVEVGGVLEVKRPSDGTNAGMLNLYNTTSGRYWHIPIRAEESDRLNFYFHDGANWHTVFRLISPLEGVGYGFMLGGDVTLYRSAADVLTVADRLRIAYGGDWEQLVIDSGTTDSRISKSLVSGTHNYLWLDSYADAGQWATIGLFRGAVAGDARFIVCPADGTANSALEFIVKQGQLRLPYTGANAGLVIGVDTNLYRLTADRLRTDDDLEVGNTNYNLLMRRNTPAIWFGDRSGAFDVTLYRLTADVLKTDDNLDALALRIGGTEVISSAQKLLNVASVVQDLLPDSDNVYDLGSASLRWRHLYLAQKGVFGDTAANPSAAGEVQRNGDEIRFHNGTKVVRFTEEDGDVGVACLRSLGDGSQQAARGFRPAAHVYHSVTQSIPSGSAAYLAFDSEYFDNDAIHDTVTNNSRLTCNTAGKYIVGANVWWASGLLRQRQTVIIKNRSSSIASVGDDVCNESNSPGQLVVGIVELDVNDYVEVYVYQNSGSAVNVGNLRFWMVKVG